jgi:hypothetical protein
MPPGNTGGRDVPPPTRSPTARRRGNDTHSENARDLLKNRPDLADEIEKKIKEKRGIGPNPIATPATPAGR